MIFSIIIQNLINLISKFEMAGLSQGGWGGFSPPPPQFLADQLTLSQPEGAHYPHPVLQAPGFSDLATALYYLLLDKKIVIFPSCF